MCSWLDGCRLHNFDARYGIVTHVALHLKVSHLIEGHVKTFDACKLLQRNQLFPPALATAQASVLSITYKFGLYQVYAV